MVFDFGVEGAAHEEDDHRECQTQDQAQKSDESFIGSHGCGVDTCGLEHFAVGFDGGLANQELLTAAQEVEIEVFLDFLLLFKVLQI